MQNSSDNRIWFAQALRGLACGSVVIYHIFGLFWRKNEIASAVTFTKPLGTSVNLFYFPFFDLLDKLRFDLGAFGVALFFLISGFVIPISLQKFTGLKFAISRICRIYPTYIIGLSISCISIFVYTKFNGSPFPFTIHDFVVNALLIRDFFWRPSIDSANWTLEIEIKFYLIACFLTYVSSLKNYKTVLSTIVCITAISCLFCNFGDLFKQQLHFYRFIYLLAFDSTFLNMMFIGTCIYNHYCEFWSLKKTLIIGLFNYFLFLLSAYAGPNRGSFMILLSSYSFAVGLFLIFYINRRKMKYSKLLDSISEISYPLYIIHGVSGYILMNVLYNIIPNPYVSIFFALAIVLLTSYLLHVFIEIPTNRLGKKLASSIEKMEICIKTNDLLRNRLNLKLKSRWWNT